MSSEGACGEDLGTPQGDWRSAGAGLTGAEQKRAACEKPPF